MTAITTNDFKSGMKIEMDKEPYTIISCQFVKPGKGQAFTRTKLKHLMTGRTLERTFRSGEKFELADVEEKRMRLLYCEATDAVFMDDHTFEQVSADLASMGEQKKWLKEDSLYDLVFYKGNIVEVIPPTFLELQITRTDPGLRGDTASGKVMKPAELETGAEIQVPIFVNEGETIKVDTRTGTYVSRT